MILVTTAGKVGTEAALLLRRRELPVRVLVRDPGKAKTLADAGAEIAAGDLDVPASIDAAMTGVTAVILVSPAVPAQELNVVASAARAGVGHVVKATSKATADSPASHAGKTDWLTGPEAISNYDVAEVLSKLLGRTITYTEVSFDENKNAMIRAGVPAPIAEMNAQAFALNAEGDAEWVTGDVATILGRPARSFEQFTADHAAAFS